MPNDLPHELSKEQLAEIAAVEKQLSDSGLVLG